MIKKRWVFALVTAVGVGGLPGLAATSMVGAAAAPTAVVFEAENGTLTGVTTATALAGYTGTGYVTGFDASADALSIPVTAPKAGLYTLSLRYAGPFGAKKTRVSVNGSGLGEVALAESTTWQDVAAGRALLKAGANTVEIQSNWGWYHIDSVSIEPFTPAPHQVTGALVNPRASASTRSLMRYLAARYGTHTLSGQQDLVDADWVTQNVGKSPAILGLDFMDYSPSRVEHGAKGKTVEDAITWDAKGGITTFSWHWNAPSGLIDTPGKEWWRGFYTEATTFDLAAAMADPASADYKLLLRDIDAIAVQLQRLEDKDIPVLWRPLHEAEGGWFWWGAKGPGPAKALYRLVYDRLTDKHGLDNLIWVWNSVAPEWYPGDDVVDVVSMDSYPQAGDHGPVSTSYDKLVGLGKDRKLVALGEVGGIPDPDLTAAYRADWSWWVTWSGSFVRDGVTNPLDFLRRTYDDERVLTLDELGDWKRAGTPTPTTTSPIPTTTSPKPSTTNPTTTKKTSTKKTSTKKKPTPKVRCKTGKNGKRTCKTITKKSKAVAIAVAVPSAQCAVTYRVTDVWAGGFRAEVSVTASRAASGWSLSWPGASPATAWGATSAGTALVGGPLAESATVTAGLLASGSPSAAPAVTCTTD